MSYDSITIPASGYVSLKKNGLSLSNIRMASIITYSRIDPPKPFCVYGNSTVAYVYGEPGTVITELKVRFWYWLNSKRALIYLYSTSSGSDAYLKYKVDGRCSVLVVANDSGGSVSCFIVGVNASRACSITWLVNTNPNVKVTYENNIVTISGISTWFSASMISTRDIEIMK